jgi:hypothetical protein
MREKYVVQYRVRSFGRNSAVWRDAQEFDTLEAAEAIKSDAIKHEAKGTKDWRVRNV